MKHKKIFAIGLSLVLTLPLLAACTKSKPADTQTERVLRIATSQGGGGQDDYFRQQFTELFEFANPNIKLEIVSTMDDMMRYKAPTPGQKMVDPLDKLKEVMAGANPPDVVMVNYDQLPDLINNNLLNPLDSMITKDKFDTSDIVPAVMDGFKKLGDGKLFALSPLFNSSALVYNKRLFDEAGVAYPKDNMTWDEMFDLARRVSRGDGDNRKYGFSFSSQSQGDVFYQLQSYTSPLQLRMFDEKGERMTVDTDQWEKIWKTMVQLQTDKVLPPPPDNGGGRGGPMMRGGDGNPFAYDDFMSSRLAMTIMNYGQLTQIANANKNAENMKGYAPIQWDAVTIPSHPENPGVVAAISMNGVMGINAKAGDPEDAWKFIKFINGEEWAKSKSYTSYQLVSRKKYIKPKNGADFHIEAFYNIKPALNNNSEMNKLSREKPGIYQVQELGRTEFQQVLQGKKTAREGLKAWQTSGDAQLQKIKDNPEDAQQQFNLKRAAGAF